MHAYSDGGVITEWCIFLWRTSSDCPSIEEWHLTFRTAQSVFLTQAYLDGPGIKSHLMVLMGFQNKKNTIS